MISVVIPTLNASNTLARAIESVNDGELVAEIIVADGGSTDDTLSVAAGLRAVVVTSEPGRGQQLAAGAAAARSSWLLFLHADSVLAEGWLKAVTGHIDSAGVATPAGYFALRYDDSHWKARWLERIVAWRSRVVGLPYGDQGLLISREFYDHLGGYKLIPIMEDVDIMRRIGRRRVAALPAAIETSARRYRRAGYGLRAAWNLFCLGLYFCRVPPRLIARIYGRHA